MFDLKSRNYLVTGAAGFLGHQHCRSIIINNGLPILLDISLSNLEKTVHKIEEEFSITPKYFYCDITSEEDLSNLFMLFQRNNLSIHGLINNASINPAVSQSISNKEFSRLESFSIKQWKSEIDVGLTGSFLCAKHFSPLLLSNSVPGVIINISSDLGLIAPDQRLYEKKGQPNHLQPVKPVTYSVIKSGILGLTRYLSTYFSGKIRSNAICPGGVYNNQNSEFVSRIESLIPLGRMANKDDLLGIVSFLLSDSSSYINGAIIPVDGGRSSW